MHDFVYLPHEYIHMFNNIIMRMYLLRVYLNIRKHQFAKRNSADREFNVPILDQLKARRQQFH